jgi:hypothetical protein
VHVRRIVPEPARHAGGRGIDDEVAVRLVRQRDDVVAGVPEERCEAHVDVGLPTAAGAGDHENQRCGLRLRQEAELGTEALEEEHRGCLPVGQGMNPKGMDLAPRLDLRQDDAIGQRRFDDGGDQRIDEREIVGADAFGPSGGRRRQPGDDEPGDDRNPQDVFQHRFTICPAWARSSAARGS